MLKFMRKNARSIFIQMAFFIIIVVFIFWGIGGFKADRDNIVAKVDNTIISASDFLKAYRSELDLYKRIYGDAFSEKVIESLNIKENVLNSLIERAVILNEARRIGLKVSEEELIKRIKGIPEFQKEGVFDKELYLSLLRREGFSPAEFEEGLRNEMLVEKVMMIVTDSVKTTEEELRELFNLHYRRINLRFIAVKNSSFSSKVDLKEDEIKRYFDSHRESFKIPRKIAINYLVITPDMFKGDITVNEKEIEDFYKKNPSMFRNKEEAPLPLKDVKKTIEEALRMEKALKSASKKAGNIVDLALKESLSLRDAAAREGLKIYTTGLFSKEERVNVIAKDPRLSDVAFSLKQGEISNPVNLDGRFYILELSKELPERIPEYRDVREDVIVRVKEEKAKALAKAFSTELLSSIKEKRDLVSLASERGLIVQETGFFSRKDTMIPRISLPLPLIEREVFRLDPKERYTLLEGKDGVFIVELIGVNYPEKEEFEREGEDFKKEVLQIKQRELFNAWIEGVKKDTKIEVNREAI